MDQPAAVELELEFQYAHQRHPALQKIRGTIPRGSCVVLCGSSGSGKSTLLRCMNQLVPQFYEGTLKGFCRLQGQDLSQLSMGETGRLAASVFQDPRSQFFTMNSSTEVAFGLENFGWSRQKMADRVEQAFARFHLEYLRDRKVFQLSSGERQLVAILAAWAMDTEIFLLDEPTANLDLHAIDQLAGMLQQLKAEGKTLILSEHRLYYLNGLADSYWVLENGSCSARYAAAEFLALTEEQRRAMGLRTTDLQRLEPRSSGEIRPEGPVLTVENLQFRYGRRDREVLRGLSFTAQVGELVTFLGPNGCGKTTLGKVLTGLCTPQAGTISWAGRPCSPRTLWKTGTFVMQEAEFQFFTNSVLHELTYGREESPELLARIEALLRRVDLWQYRHRHPFSLSGGQMQKLVLLLAVLSPKQLVVLDEPTAGLDYRSLEICAQLIREMQQTKLVLLITHDPELLALVGTRCLCLRDGQVEQELFLNRPGQWEAMLARMEGPAPVQTAPVPRKTGRTLDPRTKLCYLLAALAAAVWTDLPLILSLYTGLLLVGLWEGRWGLVLGGAGTMGLMVLPYELVPNGVTALMASFFPRILLILLGAVLVVQEREVPRILAGLRKLRVPEKAILVCSVSFRFFPVLSGDLKLMVQSIRTRGLFSTLGEKLRRIPDYVEALLVPMVFRVIRIAEALSASAETRGISLPGRRESLVSIGFGPGDWILLVVLVLLTGLGLWL